MLGKQSGQIDVFNAMIFNRLVPKDHLLLKIDSIIDFSFVYEIVKNLYSPIGRDSKDPVMMVKILLLEYLYRLSDLSVVSRIRTDIAFRWFLSLSLDDEVPDDTTISHFRIHRLKEEHFEEFFNEIVRKCIEKDLVKTRRYILDSTDVAANVNYPSTKRLICNGFRKVIKEIRRFDENLADQELKKFEGDIDIEYDKDEKVSLSKHLEIAQKHMEYLYLKTYDQLNESERYAKAYGILWDIINQYKSEGKDRIVSIVDPDARVAHKSPGNIKRGYKDHIIIDEDSEIILSSIQTPFNVGDEKELSPLIDKIQDNFEIKPAEVSADKVYGSINNRAYLKDNDITGNISFYDESNTEYEKFDLKKFYISEDLAIAKCPNGCITAETKISKDGKDITYKFSVEDCLNCPLREKCFTEADIKKGIIRRNVTVNRRYDAVLTDMKRNETQEFKDAINKRYKVERRFATLVRNHGLRRCRYLELPGAKIHITLANMACNVVRMVNILCHSKFVMS